MTTQKRNQERSMTFDDEITRSARVGSPRARWIGLVFISIAVALIIVDSTIVNVAVPSGSGARNAAQSVP